MASTDAAPAGAATWQDHKAKGNAAYTAGDTAEAVAQYSAALKDVSMPASDRAVILCNRAQCYLKTGDNGAAVDDCTSCLTLTPDNVKALFRRAAAYEAMGEKMDALQDYRQVVRLSPSVADAVAGVKRLESALNLPSTLSKATRTRESGPSITEEDRRQLAEVTERVKAVAAQKQRAVEQQRVAQRELRSLNLTLQQVQSLEGSTRVFRGIGKAFLLTPRDDMLSLLQEKQGKIEVRNKSLLATLEHLTRQEGEADAAHMEVYSALQKKLGASR